MSNNHFCVIMAGGYSNQFWPLTRESKPKQFLNVPGTQKSFIKATYDRCLEIVPKENVLVVALDKHKNLVTEQIPELPKENLLLEPYSRKTAPCIAYSTYEILKRDPEATVMVTPSDLIIRNEEAFKTKVLESFDYVNENDILMTLGVVPDRPDPNFGYIQISGGKEAAKGEKSPIKVKTFTEKPDVQIAEAFCKSGEFFWNSGIFLWKASVIKEEMEKYIPEITRLFVGWETALGSSAERVFLERAYTDCPKLYIDYGVMEKTDKVWLCPVNFGWSDIDNWQTMYENFPHKDEHQNAINTDNEYIQDTKKNIIITNKENKLVAISGLENYVVIDTDDVLLICPKDDKKYREFLAGTRMPGFEKYR